jgi:hypothetical protein
MPGVGQGQLANETIYTAPGIVNAPNAAISAITMFG